MKTIFLNPKYWDWLTLSLLTLAILILTRPQAPAVFLLFLIYLNILILRLRFKHTTSFLFIDALLVLLFSLYWQPALYLLILVMYLMARDEQWLFTLIPLFIITLFRFNDIALWLMVLFMALIATLITLWEETLSDHVKTVDGLRKSLYHSERKHHNIIEEQNETTRIAVLTERDRIAQQLHDDLGHELTAGLLSLKAHHTLLKNNRQDENTLSEALKRIENATSQLKNTVHNTKPLETYGLSTFEQHIHRCKLDIEYHKSGQITQLNPHLWPVLNQTLKEALTNILKHAHATHVRVELHKTDHVIRLTIENDGLVKPVTKHHGMGLTYMRNRIETLGGSLSIQTTRQRFTLITLIPLGGDQ